MPPSPTVYQSHEQPPAAPLKKSKSDPAPKLLRYSDAAEQMSVSLNHVRNLIDSGYLTSVEVGARGRRLLAAEIDIVTKQGIHALPIKPHK